MIHSQPRWLLAGLAIPLALAWIAERKTLCAQESALWRQRFLDEAPQAWEKYLSRAKRFQGSASKTIQQLVPEKRTIQEDHVEFKRGVGCALISAEGILAEGKPKQTGVVRAVNPRYAFELQRSRPSEPWVVAGLYLDSPTLSLFWALLQVGRQNCGLLPLLLAL